MPYPGGKVHPLITSLPEIPPAHLEAVKKFKLRKGIASLVARGRGKFTPPKPGGR
jgi:hypothetical protein